MKAWLSRLLLVVALASAGGFVAPSEALAKELQCAACGGVIGPGRYMQDQWKATYHVEHSNLPRCFYCARGISEVNTGGGVAYADGRQVCQICHATAVTDDDTAASVAARVRARMAGWGLKFDYGDIPVTLVDQATLNRLYGRGVGDHGGRISGLTTKRWTKDGNGRVVAREVAISMLYGLPLEVYEKTIAHELMHAWMFVDKQPDHTPALEEGSCNLAAYYVLQENPSAFAGFMREAMYKSNDPVYGAGLRRAIRYVQAYEFTGMVKMLRARRDFPSGF